MPSLRQGLYDLLTSCEIDAKESGRGRITPWLSQRMIIDTIADGIDNNVHEFVVLKARQVACCVAPETRILTADLRWVPIGTIAPDAEIVAFDEDPPGGRGRGRHMRTAVVVASVTMRAPVYEIRFEDGRSIVCTDQHPWLSRKENTEWNWRAIARTIRGGINGGNILTVGTKIRNVCRPWGEATYEDGWFGGLIDGEGSMSNDNQPGARMHVVQKRGAIFDRMLRYAASKGYHYSLDNDETAPARPSKFGSQPCPRLSFGRIDEVLQIIGQTRPTRFTRRFWEDREFPDAPFATIESITPCGEQDVIDLQTTTGTYIAEGLASHNTTVCSVIELFWALAHPGIQAAIIADRTDNLERLRRIFASLLETLPLEWRGPGHRIITNNRNGMVFENRSTIDLLAAGNNPDLGASRALNCMHATECAQWRSLAGVESLRASLAQLNPHRLYVWESIRCPPRLRVRGVGG